MPRPSRSRRECSSSREPSLYSAIARNKRNTVFIILLFLLIIGGLGWLASFVYGDPRILIFVVVGSVAYAVFQYFFAASQAVSVSGGIQIEKAQNPRLWRTVEN